MLTKDTPLRMSKSESKADTTTRIAKDIIEEEATVRHEITARLRKARIERDAVEPVADAAVVQKKPSKKDLGKGS